MEGAKEIKSKIEARQSFVNITKCNVKKLKRHQLSLLLMLLLSLLSRGQGATRYQS
jgi:hypothetical protein